MSAKVLETSYNSRKTLQVTSRDDAVALKEVGEGTVIHYDGHVIMEINNERTNETFKSILVVDRETGAVYATRSESFIRSLNEIKETLEAAGDTEPIDLIVTRGRSNNGRDFISCALG